MKCCVKYGEDFTWKHHKKQIKWSLYNQKHLDLDSAFSSQHSLRWAHSEWRLMCFRELTPKSIISGILPTYNTPSFCVVWLPRRPQTLKEEDAERPVFEEGFSSRRAFNEARWQQQEERVLVWEPSGFILIIYSFMLFQSESLFSSGVCLFVSLLSFKKSHSRDLLFCVQSRHSSEYYLHFAWVLLVLSCCYDEKKCEKTIFTFCQICIDYSFSNVQMCCLSDNILDVFGFRLKAMPLWHRSGNFVTSFSHML